MNLNETQQSMTVMPVTVMTMADVVFIFMIMSMTSLGMTMDLGPMNFSAMTLDSMMFTARVTINALKHHHGKHQ